MATRFAAYLAAGLALLLTTASTRASRVLPIGQAHLVGWADPADPAEPGGQSLISSPSVQEDLGLTEKQKAQLKRLDTSLAQKRREAFAGAGQGPPDPQAMMSAMTSLRRDYDAAVSKLLNKRQKDRLAQLELQREGLLAVARTEVSTKLKLTTAQSKKVKAIVDEMRRSQASLMPGPPGGGPGGPFGGGPPGGGPGGPFGGGPPGGPPPGGGPPGGGPFGGGGPPPGGGASPDDGPPPGPGGGQFGGGGAAANAETAPGAGPAHPEPDPADATTPMAGRPVVGRPVVGRRTSIARSFHRFAKMREAQEKTRADREAEDRRGLDEQSEDLLRQDARRAVRLLDDPSWPRPWLWSRARGSARRGADASQAGLSLNRRD